MKKINPNLVEECVNLVRIPKCVSINKTYKKQVAQDINPVKETKDIKDIPSNVISDKQDLVYKKDYNIKEKKQNLNDI